MEGPDFAQHLATWISPGIVARAAEELVRDPSEATDLGTLAVASGRFDDPIATGYDKLATLYLDHFFVPREVLRVARLYRPKIPREVWEQIAGITFSGTTEFADLGKLEDGRAIVLRAHLPVTQLRLVQFPIEVLADVVGDLSRYWRNVREHRALDSVHHEHRFEWELLAWIDLCVARAHGFQLVGSAGMDRLRHDYDIARAGRFDSIRGRLPTTPDELATLQFSASIYPRKPVIWLDSPPEDR